MKKFPAVCSSIGIALALLFATATVAADPDRLGRLAVEVVGLRNDRGRVCAYVFDKADAWPGEWKRALRRACSEIEDGGATFAFERLPYGSYAVSVIHDEDGNYSLTTNLIGMPKEGVGASNNPTSRFGPPSFEAARFELDTAREKIRIRIKYLL